MADVYIKEISIQGTPYKIKAAADASGNIIADTYVKKSGDTMTGTLVLSKTTDAAGNANNSPALIVGGAATSPHIEIDANEILSKSDGTTAATLYLQDQSGTTQVAGTGGLIVSAGPLLVGAKRVYNDANAGTYIGKDGTMHLTHASGSSSITFHHNKASSGTAIQSRSDGALQVSSQTTTGAAIRNIYAGTNAPSNSSGSDGEVYLLYI